MGSLGAERTLELTPSGRPVEGQFTAYVYTAIREGRYVDAVRVLEREQQGNPDSRPVLSLLGWCYYHLEDFNAAATTYGRLVAVVPDSMQYKLYHAQALFKSGQYAAAARAAETIAASAADAGIIRQNVLLLQALIQFETNELRACRSKLADLQAVMPAECVINMGAVEYKDGNFDKARQHFADARAAQGGTPDLSYNLALCLYKLGEHAAATKLLQDVIEAGAREHPELSVGGAAEGVEVRSVGASPALRQTKLIECFNLMAAIRYVCNDVERAREALLDMPPRTEEELDEVTLHNLALARMDLDPAGGFRKLEYLLPLLTAPPETFPNLMLLYCKPEYALQHLAEERLTENGARARAMPRDVYDYLLAVIAVPRSPETALRKLDELCQQHVEKLRRLGKALQDAMGQPPQARQAGVDAYIAARDAYLPCLMAQCRIYWDAENYRQVERILRNSEEFCQDHPVWKLNMAHTCFMSTKESEDYRKAIHYYEPFVAAQRGSLLAVKPSILANLCVSYIMVSENAQAEELMRSIEREEEDAPSTYQESAQPPMQLCSVNLVIGTLYCSKGNFEFGISRVITSLKPYNRKLDSDTWHYSKRCLLAMAELSAKHMLSLSDKTYAEVMDFLAEVDRWGKDIPARAGGNALDQRVSTEARLLRRMFMRLREPS